RFFQRGQAGRWAYGKWFYHRYMADLTQAHSDGTNVNGTDATIDGFTWRSRFGLESVLNQNGEPQSIFNHTTNNTYGFGEYGDFTPQYRDSAHNHWWGQLQYCLMSGTPECSDEIYPQLDWYQDQNTYQWGTSTANLFYTRAVGVNMADESRLYTYLNSVGDSTNATGVLGMADHTFSLLVDTPGCVGGKVGGVYKVYPAGCTAPPIPNGAAVPPGDPN